MSLPARFQPDDRTPEGEPEEGRATAEGAIRKYMPGSISPPADERPGLVAETLGVRSCQRSPACAPASPGAPEEPLGPSGHTIGLPQRDAEHTILAVARRRIQHQHTASQYRQPVEPPERRDRECKKKATRRQQQRRPDRVDQAENREGSDGSCVHMTQSARPAETRQRDRLPVCPPW